ncbi:MAG: hypothetical protein QM640_01820 [Niabella sp.]
MKKFILPAVLIGLFFSTALELRAQRYRSGYPVTRVRPAYRVRPHIAIGIGGVLGGWYGPGFYGYGPGVGVNIVIPPIGTVIQGLPPGAVERVYGGITYYYRNNTYYREREDGGFVVVEPPLGAEFDRLPMGIKLVKIDGQYYYYYPRNGNYYLKDQYEDGRTVYVLVGKNGELSVDEANDMRFGAPSNDGAAPLYDGNDRSYNNRPQNDEVYNNSSNNKNDGYPVVKNGNADDNVTDQPAGDNNTGAYSVRPQVGDRFDQLPRNSKAVVVNGQKQYVSPNGVYYKEVVEDGNKAYEVVKAQ